ncbi:MAG: LD-carboxypeptidase [Bacteroidota bacterium]|nr:LD-carboxypeptidase [Bacteroidota bacterium]
MQKNLPSSLLPGDAIGIISTARAIGPEELQPAIDIIESWGFSVVKGSNLHARQNQFAGTDQQRLSDLQNMLDDPSIKAILCARGGYGTARIIDSIQFSGFKGSPKWIIGYSDITALHNHIHTNFGIPTLHATMPVNFTKNSPEALESLRSVLKGKELPPYSTAAHPLNRLGSASGTLIGGNLSIIYSLCGSPSRMETRGKILFLEDLDEYLYHIDRMMLNLKRNGYLNGLSALVVGGMTDMNDNAIPFGKTAEEIIAEHVAEYSYPVLFVLPAGHIDDNRALIMGANIALDVTDEGGTFIQKW